MASPYQVLGVDPDADRETVERRYRELVKEVHPDAGGSAEEFKRVRRAYRAIVNDDGVGTAAGSSGPTGPGSSRGNRRTGPGSSRGDRSSGRTDSGGTRSGTSADRRGSSDGRGGSSGGPSGSDRRQRSRGTDGSSRGAGGRYTAAGRERRASSAAGAGAAGAAGAGATGSTGTGGGSSGSRSGTSSGGTAAEQGRSRGVPRRWFLYGFSALFAGGAYALRDQTLSDLLSDDGGGGEPERSAASGLPMEGSASREVGPQDLFDVGFETPAESTIHFTVDGADSRDWINVYTREEYERVASNWDGEGEFDPGEPLQTVLTNDGYVADLPEAGTYVILIKLWAGPPDDPRDPRTVQVSFEVTS